MNTVGKINNPEQFEVDFDENPTELYISVSNSEWKNAVAIAEENPDEARTWVVRYSDEDDEEEQDAYGGGILWRFLPLHSACARRPPEMVVNCLLRMFPYGAHCVDDQGMLPLHYACGNHASDNVVNMLIFANTGGLRVKEPNGGKLPVHHACQWGASSISVVNMLLTVYPECIYVKDNDGNTPLDLAMSATYSNKISVIKALERCADVLEFRDTISKETENCEKPKGAITASEEFTSLQSSVYHLKTLKVEHLAFKETVKSLKADLADTKKALNNSEEEVNTLEAERELLKNKIRSINNDVGEGKKQLSSTSDDCDLLKKEIGSMRDTLEERKGGLDDTNAMHALEKSSYENKILSLKKEISLMRSELGQSEASKDECSLLKEKIESMREDQEECKIEADCINVAYATEKEAHKVIRKELDDANMRAEQYEVESTASRIRLGLIKEELDDIIKLSGIQVEESSRQQQGVCLREHLNDDHITWAIISLREILRKHKKDLDMIKSLTAKVDDLESDLHKTVSQKIDLEEQVLSLSEAEKILQDKLSFLDSSLNSIMEYQHLLTEASVKNENVVKTLVEQRREKMTDLMKFDDEMMSALKLNEVIDMTQKSEKQIKNLLEFYNRDSENNE